MFLYGISYAVASLSCTIAVFISIVPTTLDGATFATNVATFIAYGLGMGMTLSILTIAVALARTGIVRTFRGLLPHMNQISGVLLILAGALRRATTPGSRSRSCQSGTSSRVVAVGPDVQSSPPAVGRGRGRRPPRAAAAVSSAPPWLSPSCSASGARTSPDDRPETGPIRAEPASRSVKRSTERRPTTRRTGRPAAAVPRPSPQTERVVAVIEYLLRSARRCHVDRDLAGPRHQRRPPACTSRHPDLRRVPVPRADDRRYHLGPALVRPGRVAAERYGFQAIARRRDAAPSRASTTGRASSFAPDGDHARLEQYTWPGRRPPARAGRRHHPAHATPRRRCSPRGPTTSRSNGGSRSTRPSPRRPPAAPGQFAEIRHDRARGRDGRQRAGASPWRSRPCLG